MDSMPHKKKKFKLSKENENKINGYLEYKRVSVSDKNTLKRYRFFLSVFLEKINKDISTIKEEDIINVVNKMTKEYHIGSMNDIKILIKSFLFYVFEEKTRYTFRNIDKICTGLRKEKTYSPEQMLNKEDIEKLVQGENEPRWKAFWLLYFYGCFRPKEVCDLEWKSILFDKDGAFIKVYVKKNGKTFEKYIPEDVCFYLKKLQNNNSKYVFPTKRTNKKGVPVGDMPQTRSGVYQRLIPLAKRVLNKHINPYILRHSIATILYNKDGLKDDDVAQQMGHSTKMKQTYNNLSVEKIRERMKKIYVKAEDLPPEKKAEYEKKIEEIKNKLLNYSSALVYLLNKEDKIKDKLTPEEQEKFKIVLQNLNLPSLN